MEIFEFKAPKEVITDKSLLEVFVTKYLLDYNTQNNTAYVCHEHIAGYSNDDFIMDRATVQIKVK